MAEQISIPIGTIKSSKRIQHPLHLPLFQFLLVRLKDRASGVTYMLNKISIPIGTIKRRAFIAPKPIDFDFNSYWYD